jgi:lactate dehydrogenase-like 2-hydroxyacid dehydrogenase
MRILVARRVPAAVAERARRDFDALLATEDMTTADVVAAAREHDIAGLLNGSRLRLGAEDIAKLPDGLRIIANPGAGYDHVDVAAAKARGIVVTNAPDEVTDCTADLAFLLILAASRRASEYHAIMRDGWRKPFGMPDMLGKRPSGQTLGIIGMGRIGQAVAKRGRGFDMRILYHNRRRLPPELEQGAEYFGDIREMLPQCRILSLHLPGGEAGTLMTREMFSLLPSGAVFVNTARGSLVDEDALIEALRSGQLYAAGLDVFRNEPDFDRRFLELANVFLIPHMGSATVETRNAMGFRALDNLKAVLSGNPPLDPV